MRTRFAHLSFSLLLVACGGKATTQDGGTPAKNDGGAKQGDGGDTSETCLGSSLLNALSGHTDVMVGGSMEDATAKSAPIDLRYIYLSGGLFDGSAPCASCATSCTAGGHTCANSAGQGGCRWWGCYQYDMDPPGEIVRDLITAGKTASPPWVAMFSYYEMLQNSGTSEGAAEVGAMNDATQMTQYFADWRFLLQQIGQDVAVLHIEPDLWGFAQQQNMDPTALPAAVTKSNATDCKSLPDTVAGVGQCLISMVRKYAPNAKVGLHASGWAAGPDALSNTDASFDLAGDADKVAAFLIACGAGDADFITVEASDRDAGYYASMGKMTSWDASNMTLPDFQQDLAWVKALTEKIGKPAIDWQLPLGNASQNDTTDHWQDNRVDYFFSHMADVATAHIVGLAFGAGATGQTTPETDGGNFVAKVIAYKKSVQALCP